MKKNRKLIIDFIRGFALANMVLYHGLYDVVYIFNQDIPWYTGRPGFLWQQAIAMTFIVISGFTRHLSKKPLKDGIIVSLAGLVVSLATALFMPDQQVVFGVLSFMGLSILLTLFMDVGLKKIPSLLGGILSLFLFAGTYHIQKGSLFWGRVQFQTGTLDFPGSFIIGLPSMDFFSTDYFPLIPWFFLYLVGYFIGKTYQEKKFKLPDFPKKGNLITYMGQNTLFLYMIHQPLLYVFLTGFFALLGN